ncbi:MAG: O-antigen ligase family protein [Patescibacteria group bacterium]|nr:O-antigen ligase family protein [Patescibacteria group bacterium]
MKHLKTTYFRILPYFKRLYIPIFLFLCFFLPFQTRIVFFTGKSQIFGIYSFYNTLFYYFTDLIITFVLILWFYFVIKDKFHVEQRRETVCVNSFLFVFWFILLISDLVSYETISAVSIFGLIKLFIIFLLFCFITNIVKFEKLVKQIFWLISVSSIIQGVIVIFQYFLQRSLGLKILGEEYIRANLPGVASFKILFGYRWIFDQIMHVSREALIVRPYGTFSHPNVMGAFMAFSALLSVYLLVVAHETWKKVLLKGILSVQIFALVISFSRVAVLSFVIGFGIFMIATIFLRARGTGSLFKNNFRLAPTIFFVGCLLLGCFILFSPQFLERTGVVSYGTSNREAVEDRVLYQKIAFNMIAKRPLTGVGYQNFVSAMDEYSPVALKDYQHQPVHNIYLLIAAESGLAGLMCFLGFIFIIVKKALKKIREPLVLMLLSVFFGFLFIGLFDHYPLTVQQGRLMFFLVAGLLFALAIKADDPASFPAD